MQRVVRLSLLGLLTASAGLAGCGDKVTVPAQTTTPPGTVVHSVTVSPPAVTVAIGAKVTLAASVDADAGVAVRTVTWTSSNTAVASVGTDGTVTGVAAGTATIIAAATADPNVKGASVVTVQPAVTTLPPTVTISSINQTNGAGQSVPANLTGAAGQLDVILNVDTNGQQLKSVSATMTCPGPTTMTQTQTISAASLDIAAEAAAAPITLSFNTALFNPTTGAPTLKNGQCTLAATATTNATTPQTATINTGLVLANADGAVITESFAGFSNAEGVATKTSANDGGGLPWKGGAPTITALPVLYSGRVLVGGSVSITLPGAVGATFVLPVTAAGAQSATWSATSGNASNNVVGLTLANAGYIANLANANPCTVVAGQTGPLCEVNGSTPLGITPQVIALDNAGNDLGLVVLNLTQPSLNLPNPAFRLDNTTPQSPTSFIISPRQAGWVNASYVFTGQGNGRGLTPPNGFGEYVSCGDGPNPTAANPQPACNPQIGVSAGGISNNGGTNGLTTFTYYAIPTASYLPASAANGTSTSATSCSTSGWTKIATAGDLAETLGNTSYVVRVFESDALLNARCSDLSSAPNLINSTAFVKGTFGVDKTAPTAAYIDYSAASSPTTASNNDFLCAAAAPNVGAACTRGIANFNVSIGLTDNASGFSGTPITAMITRLAVSPGTGLASNAAGNFNNTFACPSGLSNGACTTAAFSQTIPGDANTHNLVLNAANGVYPADASGCVGCGYFTFSETPLDLARNVATTVTGTATPTIAGAFAAAPGQRQVVVDPTAPTAGGIAVPASIIGGSSASFATNATDNLDLVSSDYTLTYSANPAGNPIANLPIRSPGPSLGAAFDNVLTTQSSFSVVVPFFIRSIAVTGAGNAPPNAAPGALAASMAVRVYDAATNASLVIPASNNGFSPIGAANVPQTNATNFATNTGGANAAAVMTSFVETNAVANVSNCPAAGCAGNAAPANATTVTLTAAASGVTGQTFQFLNPFTQVQFYYFDTVTQEYILVGSAVAPSVTDPVLPTAVLNGVRTFTWTLGTAFDPPAALGAAALRLVAIGVNSLGDGLASAVNANVTLTIT